ncbi:MAG: plastocyanin [Planctomycetota bacterium]|jgi:plastocyanin
MLMSHGKLAPSLVLLLLVSSLMPLVGCDGGPKRRGPQNYTEYRAINDPRYRGAKGGAVEDTGDGDFGPTSGEVSVTSSDAIRTGTVPNSGTVKGMVKYTGKASKPKKINNSKTGYCVEAATLYREDLLVSNSGGLQNVVVYISKGFQRFEFEPSASPFQINQQACRYVPHIVAAMAGQELAIQNSDKTPHNYHFSGLANPGINKTQAVPTTNTEVLENPEVGASFACDIHPWMQAPVYIFKHPYFTVSSEDGSFEIKNLPAGTYQISFAHERNDMKTVVQTVTIEPGKEVAINAEISR